MTEIIDVIHVEDAVKPDTQATDTTTPPAADTTANTDTNATAEPPATEQPTDYSWLEKHGVKSEADFAAILEKQNLLAQENETLKSQPAQPTYKTDFAKIADELASQGVAPEAIARFHNMKPAEMDAKTAILTQLEIKHPTLSKEDREAIYEEKYVIPADEDADITLTAGQKAQRKLQLEQDEKAAKEYLSNYVFATLNPNHVDPAVQQAEQARQTWWNSEGVNKAEFTNEVKYSTTLKLPGQNGVAEEKPSEFVYNPGADAIQALKKEFNENYLKNPAYATVFPNNAEGLQNAKAAYENMFWAKFGSDIVQKTAEYANTVQSQLHEHYARLMNNTMFTNAPDGTTANKSIDADAAATAFMKGK